MKYKSSLKQASIVIATTIFLTTYNLLWQRSYRNTVVPSGYITESFVGDNKRLDPDYRNSKNGICEPKKIIGKTKIVVASRTGETHETNLVKTQWIKSNLRPTNKPQLLKINAKNKSEVDLVTTDADFPTYLSYKWTDLHSEVKEIGMRTPIQKQELKAGESVIQDIVILNVKRNMRKGWSLRLLFVTEGCTWH